MGINHWSSQGRMTWIPNTKRKVPENQCCQTGSQSLSNFISWLTTKHINMLETFSLQTVRNCLYVCVSINQEMLFPLIVNKMFWWVEHFKMMNSPTKEQGCFEKFQWWTNLRDVMVFHQVYRYPSRTLIPLSWGRDGVRHWGMGMTPKLVMVMMMVVVVMIISSCLALSQGKKCETTGWSFAWCDYTPLELLEQPWAAYLSIFWYGHCAFPNSMSKSCKATKLLKSLNSKVSAIWFLTLYFINQLSCSLAARLLGRRVPDFEPISEALAVLVGGCLLVDFLFLELNGWTILDLQAASIYVSYVFIYLAYNMFLGWCILCIYVYTHGICLYIYIFIHVWSCMYVFIIYIHMSVSLYVLYVICLLLAVHNLIVLFAQNLMILQE